MTSSRAVQKTVVLQECRVFHDPNLTPKQVLPLLTKLVQLICYGEQLTQNELQEVFFAATKLFTLRDAHVRRLLSLLISLLAPGTESAFIVTSSLLKDLNSPVPELRSTAFRVLARIMDSTLAPNIARQTREALGDASPAVQAAAFLCARSMLSYDPDTVSKWTREGQSVLTKTTDSTVQLQCLSFLIEVGKNDVKILIQTLNSIIEKRSKLSTIPSVFLITVVGSLLSKLSPMQRPNQLVNYLVEETKSTSHSISVTACRQLTIMSNLSQSNLMDVQSSLKYTLSSSMSQSIQKLAAARSLEILLQKFPDLLSTQLASLKLDGLEGKTITSIILSIKFQSAHNQSEILTDLKKLSRILKSFGSDSLRLKVISSMASLPIKSPGLAEPIMQTIGQLLREDNSQKVKNSMFQVIRSVAESSDYTSSVADFLSDFIEDCEFTSIAVEAISLLGACCNSMVPSLKYVRSLINRLLLENTVVRCAALSTLASIAANISTKISENQSINSSDKRQLTTVFSEILTVIKLSLADSEDEVRDLAAYLHLNLTSNQKMIGSLINENEFLAEDKVRLNGEILSLTSLENLIEARKSSLKTGADYGTVNELLTSAAYVEPAQQQISPSLTPVHVPVSKEKQFLDLDSLPSALSSFFSNTSLFFVGETVLSEEGLEYKVLMSKYMNTEGNAALFEFAIEHSLTGQLLVEPVVEVDLEDDDFTINDSITIKSSNVLAGEDHKGTSYYGFMISTTCPLDLLSTRFQSNLIYGLADSDPSNPLTPIDPIMTETQELDVISFDLNDLSEKNIFVDPSKSWSDAKLGYNVTETLKLPYPDADATIDAISTLFGAEESFKKSTTNSIKTGWDFDLIDGNRIVVRAEIVSAEQVIVKLRVKSTSQELLTSVSQLFF
ncbi:hypothetical protein RCL1_005945 [Eukaryota sp. TZLM3-RCL]